MSKICRFNTPSLCLQSGLALLLTCSLAIMAQADDQTMRTFYPNDSSSAKSVQYPPQAPGVGQAMQGLSTPSYPNSTYPNPSYSNSTYPSSNAWSSPAGGDSNIPPAVRNLIGPRHLPSAMQNPANVPFQGGESAQEAEHQRVLNNMRASGRYSEDRIRAMDPYIHQAEEPGMTYRMVNGIKVRNDGMTVDQAFNNIKTNGLLNTPISTDPNYYAPGSYGWYKTHGGNLPFAKWVEGER